MELPAARGQPSAGPGLVSLSLLGVWKGVSLTRGRTPLQLRDLGQGLHSPGWVSVAEKRRVEFPAPIDYCKAFKQGRRYLALLWDNTKSL